MKKIAVLLLLVNLLLFSSCLTFTSVEKQEQVTDIPIAMNYIKDFFSQPVIFQGGAQGVNTILLKMDIDSIRPIPIDDLKNLKISSSGQYLLTDEYNKRYVFMGEFTDIWTNTNFTGYFSIQEYDDDDYDKQHPFPQDMSVKRKVELFLDNHLYGSWTTNPKPQDMEDVYYFTTEDNTSSSLKILAYRIYIRKDDSRMFWFTVRNTSEKTIIGFKGSFILLNKFNESISKYTYTVSSDSENLAPKRFATDVGGWEEFLANDGKKIIPKITKVYFDDGTIETPVD